MEKRHFRYMNRTYVAKYTPNREGQCSLWSVSAWDDTDIVFLGYAHRNGMIEEADLSGGEWSLSKGAERLFAKVRAEGSKVEVHDIRTLRSLPFADRNAEIVRLREEYGLSFRRISWVFGLSKSSVHDMYVACRRSSLRPRLPKSLMTARLLRLLTHSNPLDKMPG